jgi:hypothetical protein
LWRGTHGGVSGLGEQPEEAATGGVIMEEDDRGGDSHGPAVVAGAVSGFSVQEGHDDEALLLEWSDNSEAARRQLVMVGEAALGAE